jgi:hypothetical protein
VGWITTAAGRRTWGAIKGSGRADYFDCRAYGTALALALLVHKPEPVQKSTITLDDPFMRRLLR